MENREIKVYMDDESFFYDAQGLLMAFYPGYKPVLVAGSGDADIVIGTPVGEDRRQVKNLLKKELYHRLKKKTGTSLPWGTLTGVRPTKLVLRLISEGMDYEDMVSHMKSEYLTSDEKARLATDIAIRETGMIKACEPSSVCLYIGIPFCPSICLYCSFSSYAIGAYQKETDLYVEALKREIAGAADALSGRRIVAIYFGGGTPTSLTATQLEEILETVEDSYDLSRLSEYTVEAGRPDSITAEKLDALKRHGVTRISINPQTLQQRTLDTIGRRHTVEDFYRAYELSRSYPFMVNTDLIVGLPGEGEAEVRDTLDRIMALSPDNLTVHSLAKKRASRLTEEWEQYAGDAFVYTSSIEHMVYDAAKSLSMEPYYMYRQKNIAGNMENVGFAKRGQECLYNVLMMEEACDIAAFGAGAVSKTTSELLKKADRLRNPKDVRSYIDRIDEVIEKKLKFF